MNNINPNTIILPNSIYPQLNFALDLKLSIDISTVHITRGNWAEEVIEERDRSHNRLNKIKLKKKKKKKKLRNFPGGPMAKTLRFQCRGPGFNLWSGN